MRLCPRGLWIAAFLAVIVSVGIAAAEDGGGEPGADAEAGKIAALIGQLGDNEFSRREAAGRELQAVGEHALPALRRAAVVSPDLETQWRARRLVGRILREACTSKSTGLEMVLVQPGEFLMGSPTSENIRQADETQHRVRIGRPYLLAAREVTQDEYRRVMDGNPSSFSAQGEKKLKIAGLNTARFPVENVTWYDALEFCNRLSERDGLPPHYRLAGVKRDGGAVIGAAVSVLGGEGYRLPTEAEWEYACRAGSAAQFHFGNGTAAGKANVKAMATGAYGVQTRTPYLGRTTNVGSYAPNAWGLYDMHGNVAEWCWDWYDKDYYAASPDHDPRGPGGGDHRVMRGGSWLVSQTSARSATRYHKTPGDRDDSAGFRVARNPSRYIAPHN